MIATVDTDPDGELYALAREALGPDRPVVATVDLHANISERMAVCLADVADNPGGGARGPLFAPRSILLEHTGSVRARAEMPPSTSLAHGERS